MKAHRKQPQQEDGLRPEYDFTGGVRGKYLERYREGTNVILLDPDVAAVFQDSAAVNETLRRLVSLAEAKAKSRRPAPREGSKPNKTLQLTSRAQGGVRKSGRAVRG